MPLNDTPEIRLLWQASERLCVRGDELENRQNGGYDRS